MSMKKQPEVARTCQNCKSRFYAPKWRVRQGGAKFCSVSCKHLMGVSTNSKRKMRESHRLRLGCSKERFEKRFVRAESGCWNWVGSLVGGYGQFRIMGKLFKPHRLAYEWYVGSIPRGILVLHKCDNRRCVNPNHLFLGTYQTNMDDKHAKSRAKYAVGETHPCARFTAEDILEMRRMGAAGISPLKISIKFAVHKNYVDSILSHRRWKNLGGYRVSKI